MTRLEDAVEGALELLGITDTRVHGKTGTGKVQRVHDQERCGSGKTTRGDVAEEAGPEASRAGDTEPLLVVVLEGEVERLGREVADDVGQVALPEGSNTLLLGDTRQDVHDASVLGLDLLGLALVLQQQLDALNGRSDRLGDSSGDTSEEEVFRNVGLLCLLAVRHDGFLMSVGSEFV